MNVVIYRSFSIYLFVLIYGAHTFSIDIKGSELGLVGENGTQIECSFTPGDYTLFSVSFLASNKSSAILETIATYNPDKIPKLTIQGQYLKGRVTLTPLAQSPKAVMTFTKLMCIDGTFYKCQVVYQDTSGTHYPISSPTSISIQVPPSKPDSISLVHSPTKHMDYSTSLPSTVVTSKENNTVSASKMESLNITTVFNNSTIQTTDHITTSTPYHEDDVSSNVSYKTTTHSIQQTTTAQGIAEGDNITVVCTGDVGKPPAKHVFQKYNTDDILYLTYTATETSISEISENCSNYRTSNITFQVTADDNNAVIRCVVNSSMVEPDMYVETEPLEVYSDIPTTQPSSTGSSSGIDKKEEKSKGNLVPVIVSVGAVIVVVIVVLIVIIVYRRRKSKSPTFKNESNSFDDSKPKPYTEPRTGDYDYIALDDDPPKTKSSNNGLEVEDVNKHNEEYLKKQEEEEKKKNESNTPPQPAVYAQVNEATKSKNKPKTESTENNDKQEEDPYAETQEDVYDKAGNSRHKQNENVEHFDSLSSSKQNSNGDNKQTIQTSQVGSFTNQGFEKDENRKVATVSPTVRSSSGSQNDEQTNLNRNSQSKKGYENIIGTDQTGISVEESSHRTAL